MLTLAIGCFLALIVGIGLIAWVSDKERGNTCIHCHKPGGGHHDCCIEVTYER